MEQKITDALDCLYDRLIEVKKLMKCKAPWVSFSTLFNEGKRIYLILKEFDWLEEEDDNDSLFEM